MGFYMNNSTASQQHTMIQTSEGVNRAVLTTESLVKLAKIFKKYIYNKKICGVVGLLIPDHSPQLTSQMKFSIYNELVISYSCSVPAHHCLLRVQSLSQHMQRLREAPVNDLSHYNPLKEAEPNPAAFPLIS